MKNERINRVLIEMNNNNLDQILVTSKENIFYFTGKWINSGERMIALLIKSNGEHLLIYNKLFIIKEDLGINMINYDDSMDPIEILEKYIDINKPLGIDKDWQAHFLIKLLDKGYRKFVNGSQIVSKVRIIKDAEEINLMKISSEINDKVMKKLWDEFKEGNTEYYYTNVLKELYKEEGVKDFSFAPIIAFGSNGANPHYESGENVLKKGDTILIDIGGIYKNYCSDMTRTVFYGEEPEKKIREIYEIVKEANLIGISAVKAGKTFSSIDMSVREYISSMGYGDYFIHRTGHGIGIETHEPEDVSSNNYNIVKEGMTFSIEPGIYLMNKIGIRIEDLVLVKKDGCEVLNDVTKEIVVLD
ncbi:MAG: aminopeptidase P family protein [Clostridiales bacterium]|nr:aminopeptidase P family protein [Clostridiales bacterium]